MQLLITLKNIEESKKFIDDFDVDELRQYLDFIYISNFDIIVKDRELQISYISNTLWIESEDFTYTYIRLPLNLIHVFIVKEN